MKESNIKVIITEPMRQARICTIKNELKEFQRIVGGNIETLCFNPEDDNAILICNENGKMNQMPWNRLLIYNGEAYDIVAGPMIIAGDDYINGEFKSLTDKQAENYLNQFFYPEIHYVENGKLKGIAFDDPLVDYENFSEFTTEGRRQKYDNLLRQNYIFY